MPLDPIARRYLDLMARLNARPVETLSIAEARAQMPPAPRPLAEVGRVSDRRITGPGGEIPLRVYAPIANNGSGELLPLLIFFHGGGWVVGDLETHDGLCRNLANAVGAITLSVDYRRAPEHKYPAAAEDAYAVTCWAAKHASELAGDAKQLIVAGDSAGGNLAAVAALMARDRGGPHVAQQLLLYPVTDHAFDTPSYREFAEGYFLTQAAMRWFWLQYLPDERKGRDAYASPLCAADLSGLPPALVITAECDVLRDEGESYAARLSEAGIAVEIKRCEGMIHGFLRRTDVFPQALQTIDWIGQRLRTSLAATAR